MSHPVDRERKLVAYLLGRLPPAEHAEMEERVFVDDDANEELWATADDLIHAYLADTLSPEDRERFESHFLTSPRRRERLEFVRSLLTAVERVSAARGTPDRVAPARRSWSPWAVAAAVLVAVATILLLVRRVPRPVERASTSPQPSATASPATPGSPAIAESSRPDRPSPRASASSAEFPLVQSVHVPRGASQPVDVALLARAGTVRLEVEVEGGHPGYDAVLRRGGKPVWRAEGLTLSRPEAPLRLDVPAGVFTTGEHTLSVEAEPLRSERSPAPLVITLRVSRDR